MILTDAQGRPIPRPEPADYPDLLSYVRAYHAWGDQVRQVATSAFDEALRLVIARSRLETRRTFITACRRAVQGERTVMGEDQMPPHETQMEWIRFLDTSPSIKEIADWCTLKAAEIGWNFYDLSLALNSLKKVQLPTEPPKESN